jgi:hypothetical protein
MNDNSGEAALREAVRIKLKRGPAHASVLARSVPDIGLLALQEWANNGRGKLTPSVMSNLAKELFGSNCHYDATCDLLVRAEPKITPLCTAYPTPYVPTGAPLLRYPEHDLAPRPVKPEPTKPPQPKSGWHVW